MAALAVFAAWAALAAKKRVREACTRGEKVVVLLHPCRPFAAQPIIETIAVIIIIIF